ncbi:hypothetical protein AHF37_07617 [Paragonimus kellicotti]|nr:hypothetical protein AHF37_07617 [Paragonimus kellicotti]
MALKPVTKNAVCDCLSDFIESTIHTYLYQRGVYPRSAYTEFSIFGVNIQLCRNPEVRKYISDCVESIRPHLAHIHELRILIRRPRDSVNASDGFLESLILRFGQINLEFIRRDISSTVLREYFATALLRLNLLECNYPPLEFG